MKRIERIYDFIKQESAKFTKDTLAAKEGLDAQEIADALNILRNNVSKELNELVRQELIVKFGGRPVHYVDRAALEQLYEIALPPEPLVYESFAAWKASVASEKKTAEPFDALIGAHRSLKRQVEQAKAAILYPPDGLHTLIVGQTGVGKTLFAHLMFAYGKTMGRFADDAPFVTFNCADYYNNPQLLLSHIFGHIKGAFTGADQAKAGLVEEADGGVLFLDEIHRLPPEGQEMIFYFMDTGTYNRLGETTRARKAKVLIIGATTEDPKSALTKTFVRRIPNIIAIPTLESRSLGEKMDIIRMLFTDEAQRVKKPIRISVEAVKSLIGSIGTGNVGQLKSNIKLLCAQAFLNGIDNPEYIEVDFRMLPQSIKNGLLTLSANRQALTELTKYLAEPMVIEPPGRKRVQTGDSAQDQQAFNLYRVVEDKVELLKGEGISDDLIKQIVATDVNVYIRQLYDKRDSVTLSTRDRLLKIVDEPLVDFSEQISLYVQKRLNRSYRDRFLYAFSLHLSAFLKRIKDKEVIPYSEIAGAIEQDSLYYQVALEIKVRIEKHYRVTVPPTEVEYIALLLESAEDDDLEEKVIILVAMHGAQTASSMVDVAQKLFNTQDTNLIPIDMPLDKDPQEIADNVLMMLRGMNCRQGVLILADMGSLVNLGAAIHEQLHIPVRTLDMVSTPLILEAMRKADIAGMDLESIYESLSSFRGYETIDVAESRAEDGRQEAVVTICSTGKGAALKLKSLVEAVLKEAGKNIAVLPVGLVNLEEHLKDMEAEYAIRATVGMKKPELPIPFIPIEEFVGGAGEDRLLDILRGRKSGGTPLALRAEEGQKSIVVRKLCEESLTRFLTYLNPAKIMDSLMEFDRVLEQELGKQFSKPIRIRIIVHCGCALERAVTRTPLRYEDDKSEVDTQKLAAIQKAAGVFENTLKLRFDADELCFMAKMI
ncbi:sigma-54-dependent transcriptional regulator [Selenomonas sp.]|uniref:sigma-54-dependent transcriptional regulator n=1 Tax=Selenomonas sp. TaxID=2053611 RepID=UPI0025ED5167|nr:sigma-54-dependent transcriptional regulator [Selenomonas sp.]MCI6084983.1 sigma 54-interacting transcriptional regulator [Selenomonas sp.]MDY3297079.1 sigma 54-interacting transcriptional regulator [Selenomonas sp.]MDY4414937.1 sigma 54-interacting transcriptional regulator [Selenomonas sp.]